MYPSLVSNTVNRRVEIDRSPISIGANQWRADVHLPEADVADLHCELRCEPDGLWLIDLSKDGVLVNGQKVNQTILQEGDQISVGSIDFVVEGLEYLCSSSSDNSFVNFEDANDNMTFAGSENDVDLVDSTADSWLVLLGETSLGPMSSNDVIDLLETGQVTNEDHVRHAASDRWMPMPEWRELDLTPFGSSEQAAEKEESRPSSHSSDESRGSTPAPMTRPVRPIAADSLTTEWSSPLKRAGFQSPSDHPSAESKQPSTRELDLPVQHAIETEAEDSEQLLDFVTGPESDRELTFKSVTIHDLPADVPTQLEEEKDRPRTRESLSERPETLSGVRPAGSVSMESTIGSSSSAGSSSPNVVEQFLVVLAHREEGPIPFAMVQDLADRGLLKPLSPMRREIERAWSTAQVYGVRFANPDDDEFEVPEDHPTRNRLRGRPQLTSQDHDEPDELASIGSDVEQNPVARSTNVSGRSSASSGKSSQGKILPNTMEARGILGGLVWIFVAPFYFFASAIGTINSEKNKAGAIVLVAVLGIGFGVWSWVSSWTQTALQGVITLDGEELPNVMITATGMLTGESAVGVSDSSGEFELVTLHGALKPGVYHVVVKPLDPDGDPVAAHTSKSSDPRDTIVPAKYQDLSTTQLTLEVDSATEFVELELTRRIRRKRQR